MARRGGSVRRGLATQRRSAKYISLDEKPLPTLPAPMRLSVVSQRTFKLQARQTSRRRATLARETYPLTPTKGTQPISHPHARPQRHRSVRAGKLTPMLIAEAFGELSDKRRTVDGMGNKYDIFIAPEPLKEGEIHPALRREQSKRCPRERRLRFDLEPTTYDRQVLPRQLSQRKSGLRAVRSVPDLLHRLQPNIVRCRKRSTDRAENLKPTAPEETSIERIDQDPATPASERPIFFIRYFRKIFADRKPNGQSTWTQSGAPASESADSTVDDVGQDVESRAVVRPLSRTISVRPVKRRNSKLSGRHSMGTIRRQMFPAGRNVGQKEEEQPAQSETQRLEQENLRSKYDTLLKAAKKKRDLAIQEEPSSPLSVRCRGGVEQPRPAVETGLGLEMDIRPDFEVNQSPQDERKEDHTGYDFLLWQEATMGDSYYGTFDQSRWSAAAELEEQRPVTPALTADVDEPVEANDANPSRAQSVSGSQGVGRTCSVYSAQSQKLEGAEADNWVHVGPVESIPISPEDLLDNVRPYLLYSEQHEKTSPSLSPASGMMYLSNRASELVSVGAGGDFATMMTPALPGH